MTAGQPTSSKLELYRDERVRLGRLLAEASTEPRNPERVDGLHADLDELEQMIKAEEARLRRATKSRLS